MTKLLTVIIILLSAVLVGIILYPQLQENRPQTLKFVSDSSVAALPFLVALNETLFTPNRIIPEISYYSDPEKALDELFAGSVDIGIFPWSTVFKRIASTGDTLKVFMAIEFRPALPVDAIVQPVKKKIKNLRELKGKKLGYPPILRDYIPLVLSAANLTPAEVKLTEAPVPALLSQLANGELDAIWLIEPFISTLDFGKFDTASAITTKYITGPFPAFAVGFSPQFLKKTTKIQRTRLKIALDAAVEKIDARPGEARITLGKFFFDNDSICNNVRLPQFQRITEINKPGVQVLANRLLGTGVLNDTIDAKDIFVQPAQMMR